MTSKISSKVTLASEALVIPPDLECIKQEVLEIEGNLFSFSYYCVPEDGDEEYGKSPILSELYQCYSLVRKIRDYYVESGMGWDKYRKFEELETPGMHYIMVKLLSKEISDKGQAEGDSDDSDDGDEVSSVYSFSEKDDDEDSGYSNLENENFEGFSDADLSGFESDLHIENNGLEALDEAPKEPILKSEKIVGFVSYFHLVNEDPSIVFLYELHVKSKYQGIGLAATLMDKYENSSIELVEKYNETRRQKSLKRVNLAKDGKCMLTVFRMNVKARKFYRKLGYMVSTVMGDDDIPSDDDDSLDLEFFDNNHDINRLEAEMRKDALKADKNKVSTKKRKRKSSIYKGWLELEKPFSSL